MTKQLLLTTAIIGQLGLLVTGCPQINFEADTKEANNEYRDNEYSDSDSTFEATMDTEAVSLDTKEDGGDTESPDVTSIAISPYQATYYSEEDGLPGPVVFSETVDNISQNYSYDNFKGIDSYNFYGTWEGVIEVTGAPVTLFANVSISWSEVSITVDDVIVAAWSNQSKTIPLDLESGSHTIKVECYNNWYTTNISVSFSSVEASPLSDIEDLIAKIAEHATHIHAISLYESGHIYNEVVVNIPESDESLALFLASYESVNWVINNPNNTEIVGIVYGAYDPSSIVTNDGDAVLIKASDLDSDTIFDDIEDITGKYPDSVYEEYSVAQFDLD